MSSEKGLKFMLKSRLQSKVVSSLPVRFLKAKMVDLTGKSFVRGVYKKNDTLLKIPNLPEKAKIVECCSEIEKFCKAMNSVPYFFLLPTKFQLNGGFANSSYFNSPEKDLINFFCLKLNRKLVNLQSNFFSAYLGNIDFFYRTDSCLNSYGNFLMYSSILKQMGLQPLSIDCFRIRTCSEDFYGDLFSENFVDFVKPDIINLFEVSSDVLIGLNHFRFDVKQINSNLSVYERNTIFDLSKLAGSSKKDVFFGEGAPLKIVETNGEDAENILIFSDGKADGLMQFLVFHFKNIVVVDLKKLKLNCRGFYNFFSGFKQKHGIKNFEKVLFLYGVESLADSKIFEQLSLFL